MFSVFRACVSFGPRNRSIGAAAKSQVCFHEKLKDAGYRFCPGDRGGGRFITQCTEHEQLSTQKLHQHKSICQVIN